MNKIEIPLSKTKLLSGIAGSAVFAVVGLYLFMVLAGKPTGFNPSFLRAVGAAGILFFSATGIYGFKKLFDRSVGLTIDDAGITDNTNATSIGLIRWSDITGIETKKVMSTSILLIFTKEPNTYLGKATGMKKKLMQLNMKMYGSPLSIVSTTLRYDFDSLEKIIQDRFAEQAKLY